MPPIDRAYLAIALALLIVSELAGSTWGGAGRQHLAHIAIVLIGFVTLAIFGMIFRLWPTMKSGVIARVQFSLTVVGLAGILIDSVQQTLNGSVLLLASGSAVMIAGTFVLAWPLYDRGTG